MVELSAPVLLCRLFMGIVALPGCGGDHHPPRTGPSLSPGVAHVDTHFDVHAAQALISTYRSENGLAPVTIDPELMRLAHNQARAMATHNELEHDVAAPFAQRIQNSKFDASVAVENIAAGYRTLGEAFAGWRKSPPHRANMLNRYVTRMGIAAAYAPHTRYKVFWSLILARPDVRHRQGPGMWSTGLRVN